LLRNSKAKRLIKNDMYSEGTSPCLLQEQARLAHERANQAFRDLVQALEAENLAWTRLEQYVRGQPVNGLEEKSAMPMPLATGTGSLQTREDPAEDGIAAVFRSKMNGDKAA
jgi:hypothetical protein